MRLFEEKRIHVLGVPFVIRKVGQPAIHKGMGSYVLFDSTGKFKCRGTFKLCKEWARHFAEVSNEIQCKGLGQPT
jgi:hypothetical protein